MPTEQERRLQSLDSYEIMDTPSEPQFDDIVKIAARYCGTPVALVSLLDGERQWFKAKEGLDASQTPIGQAVCAHAIREKEILVIRDLTQDARTKDNPLVTDDPKIRFYAGAVLRTPRDVAIGTLCVIDTKPRPQGLTPDQTDVLLALARQTMLALEARRLFLRQGDALLETKERAAISEEIRKQQFAVIMLGDSLRNAQTRAEIVEHALQTLADVLKPSRAGYADIDSETGIISVGPDWTDGTAPSAARQFNLADLSFSAERLRRGDVTVDFSGGGEHVTESERAEHESLGTQARIVVPVLERGRLVGSLFVHQTHPREWTASEIAFVRTVADRTYAAIANLRAEDEQHLLNRELSHRLKNTLSMVQAIASQTLRGSANQAEVQHFMRRIIALSTAHDVLLQENWLEARLQTLVEAVLATQSDIANFDIQGANITVGPKTALSISMLLHELETNAVKYGALSVAGGRVAVLWSAELVESKPVFRLTWQEQGGPPVQAPTHKGFGSRMIKMGIGGTGTSAMDYLPEGLRVRFEADLTAIQNN